MMFRDQLLLFTHKHTLSRRIELPPSCLQHSVENKPDPLLRELNLPLAGRLTVAAEPDVRGEGL
jgi:hypothetical protein